jgi:hypothetical protein
LFPSWFKKKAVSTKKQTIDVVSNKLATDCTPPRARKDITGGDASSFSSDRFVTGGAGAANTSQNDDIHKCTDIKPSVRLEVNPAGGSTYQFVADVTQGTHALSSSRFPGTVIFAVDGQQVHSAQIGSPGQVSFTYNATTAGSHTVTATVVDSVLYEAADTGSLTASGDSSAFKIDDADWGGGMLKVSWSGGSGAVTIYNQAGNAIVGCGGGGNGSCNVPTGNPGSYVTAKDSSGKSVNYNL